MFARRMRVKNINRFCGQVLTLWCLNAMQEVSTYRQKARDEVPDGSDELGLAYVNDALAILPDNPRLLINRTYFHLLMDAPATVRS